MYTFMYMYDLCMPVGSCELKFGQSSLEVSKTLDPPCLKTSRQGNSPLVPGPDSTPVEAGELRRPPIQEPIGGTPPIGTQKTT